MRRAAVPVLLLALAPLSGAGWRRSADRSNASARASGDGRGPVPDPTKPWWLNDAPLQNVTGPLPAEADTVIVGAGITGGSVARHLAQLAPQRAAETLVLDARGAAGGATGRNGGQCGPMDCYDFESLAASDGLEEALAERSFQFETMDLVQEYVAEHEVEADLRFGGAGVQWFTNRDRTWGESAHATCLLHAGQCGDPYCARSELLDSAEAEERMKSPDFLGAIFQPAGGSIWGAKIAFALLEEAIEGGVTLRTQTAVTSVERDGEEHWLVHTDAGDVVRARHVVLATNAYTGSLVPELEGEINPWRDQVVIVSPATVYHHAAV